MYTSDSIMAFEIESGKIRWFRQLSGYDILYFACLDPNSPDCPPGQNLDADFGDAPMLLSIVNNGKMCDIVAAVQKSRYAWALDRDSGDVVWSSVAGPGGLEGGGVWGAPTDEVRVYTNIVNTNRVNYTLVPSTSTTTAGLWAALNANTGKVLWSTANPTNNTLHGPVTLANGVLFGGSVAPTGPLYAMDAASGKILWSYDTGATVYGGVSMSYGCVYLGTGYSVNLAVFHPTWTSGTSLFAFCIV